MLVGVLVLVSIALCITLGILLFGSGRGSAPGPSFQQKLDAQIKARESAELELDRRRADLEEQRTQLVEVREQLKQAKKKLFDQREGDRDGREIAKARSATERMASVQLDSVRLELATALAEIEKIKKESGGERIRRPPTPPPPPAPAPPAAVAAPPPPPPPARKFRELSDADKERIQRLEQQTAKDRARSLELERETKRLRGRTETQHRIYVVTKGELDLLKDKFKALEKRLNRTLLEKDLVRRAIKDLERKSGILAERTELTAEEIADSDRKVEEKAVAEATVEAAHLAKQESEEAKANPAIQKGDLSGDPSRETHEAGGNGTA
ncbi:MAG TPA: cell envelope biogenesis protein TolA [Myxococcaceae bacterium]|nr:cell envelope biogenesis protein TolA [Myxococcaceae bacterium]